MQIKLKDVKIALKIFMCAAVLVSGCALKNLNSGPEKVSQPLEYSGYSKEEYKGHEKRSEYVEMSDGVKLAVDIYIPKDGPERAEGLEMDSFPVVFQFLPYQRSFIDLIDGPFHRLFRKILFKSADPVIDMAHQSEMVKLLLSHGYAYVIADMRGTGASYGWKMDMMPRIGKDGAELVNWIAEQPFCNGNVGMFGSSYLGYSQLVTASNKPPALKCIFPEVIFFDGYSEIAFPGGIYLQGFMDTYSDGLKRLNLNHYHLDLMEAVAGHDISKLSVPCAPVEDEDGDGGLLDEIPIDMNGNGTFLDDYDYPENPAAPPRYRDGNNREHMYYLATKDHEKNLELRAWVSSARYLDGEAPEEFPGLTAYDISPSGHAENIMEFGIPIYHRGGWMDGFTRGTFELYSTMKGKNPSRVIIDAGYHTGKGPFWKYLGERQKKVIRKINLERLRFFDRYLKGIDNGIDEEQPILIYVMNGVGWRSEKEWPLERRVETGFYFSEDKRLSRKQGPEGSDEYKADFTHDSRYGNRKANRYTALYSNIPDKLAVRTEKDKKCLVYETGPMVENMEVTGHPMVHLWVSSSADYGDFFVYLVDVDRAGEAVLVSEGMLRAGFAGLYDNDQMIYSGEIDVEVRPELPWHGYESGHYVDRILADGNIVELVIDLQPTSWVFRKGHKIRLAIACADWPTFRLHEKLAPKNHPDDPANIIPSITVYRDAEHPSQIILPVIPY